MLIPMTYSPQWLYNMASCKLPGSLHHHSRTSHAMNMVQSMCSDRCKQLLMEMTTPFYKPERSNCKNVIVSWCPLSGLCTLVSLAESKDRICCLTANWTSPKQAYSESVHHYRYSCLQHFVALQHPSHRDSECMRALGSL